MAAYAALVSVMHIIDQIEHHPHPPISFDKDQVESLTETVKFLQEFLEGYSHVAGYATEADPLESRIADAAYAAEDVIESHVVDQITSGSTGHSQLELHEGLRKVIEDMDSIKKEVMEFKEKTGVQHQHQRDLSVAASSGNNTTMVGFDDVALEIMGKLTGGQLDRGIIPIVGMGGIGKTTLARNIFEKQLVVEHFDIRVWLTVSQVYIIREILLEVLGGIGVCGSQMNEDELGEKIYKSLCGMRYLIVMDDIWDIQVWNQLHFFFPDNHNGSRIMVTTRLSILAFQLSGSYGFELEFLDEDNSWKLFRETVFVEEDCPLELKEIGEQISRSCKGIPLSIVVIGGLLAESRKTRQYWEYIARNLNSIVNLEDNERCSQILYLSYNSLPVYLKPCFLYMGVFPEDSEIRANILIKKWVAEGFLKPISGKSLEKAGEEYLEELVDRNLILVEAYSSVGWKIKLCKIHDLLRDLCLREARKQRFLFVLGEHRHNVPQELSTERRIFIDQLIWKKEYQPQILDALESSRARSLTWDCQQPDYLPSFSSRLLRVSYMVNHYMNGHEHYLDAVIQQVNLRYLSHIVTYGMLSSLPSSISLLWNLQTLVVRSITTVRAPSEIWNMPQLRHVWFTTLELPDPPSSHGIVLANLQTLSYIYDFKCSEEVVKRIPNIRKLELSYNRKNFESLRFLSNLDQLHKLESLRVGGQRLYDPKNLRSYLEKNLILPHSLKKLTLYFTHLHWEDLTTKVGSLPSLEVLKLRNDAFVGPEWKTVEGNFCSLKVLLIEDCDLECWTTDNTHFPRLERLVLLHLEELREIPSSIGDIPTLELIELRCCGDLANDSAKRIQEEQEEHGNEDLQFYIW